MDDDKTQGGGASRRPLGFGCRPLVKDFLRNIRTKGLKKKSIINAREGSSKPTRVVTHPRLRQYRFATLYRFEKVKVNRQIGKCREMANRNLLRLIGLSADIGPISGRYRPEIG